MFRQLVKRAFGINPLEFHKACDKMLEVIDIQNLITQLDIEEFDDLLYSDGVITLNVKAGEVYVINKQTPNQQIWIVSPYSGTGRYELEGNDWNRVGGGGKLNDLLTTELTSALGKEIKIKQDF